ncbi:MAG: hypothetical protein JSV93_02675 [Candidatus Omnitrophota bacterium]|nr:MAG: hypothetical protein JSV93_02675 [Candidatus Omnitrophota bacterium]
MFKEEKDPDKIIKKIVEKLSSHKETSSHARHIPANTCKDIGLKVTLLEDLDKDLQDLVLTIHHAFMHTFTNTVAIKITENHKGVAMVIVHRAK